MLSLQESYKERLALHFATNALGATIMQQFRHVLGFSFVAMSLRKNQTFRWFTKDRLKQLLFLSHFGFIFYRVFSNSNKSSHVNWDELNQNIIYC